MPDPLKARLDYLRAHAASARRRAGMYSEMARMGGRETASSLNALRNAPAPGKKLQKAGFIMLWIPEPTGVTIAAGAPMILAGRYLETRYNSATITDIGKTTRSVVSGIGDFGRALRE